MRNVRPREANRREMRREHGRVWLPPTPPEPGVARRARTRRSHHVRRDPSSRGVLDHPRRPCTRARHRSARRVGQRAAPGGGHGSCITSVTPTPHAVSESDLSTPRDPPGWRSGRSAPPSCCGDASANERLGEAVVSDRPLGPTVHRSRGSVVRLPILLVLARSIRAHRYLRPAARWTAIGSGRVSTAVVEGQLARGVLARLHA